MSSRRRTFMAVAVAIVVPVVLAVLWREPFHAIAGSVAAPVPIVARSLDAIRRALTPSASDERTLADLRDEVNRLTVEVARLRHLESENAELRDALQFSKREHGTVAMAGVIGHTVDPERNSIIIDRGSNDGVAPGLVAVAGDGSVVGIVTDASARRATITLVTDEQSRMAVAIEGTERVQGVLEGGHGTGTRMRLIPATATIAAGDVVVTSDLDASIPAGLVVGTVESVRDEENIPFQVAVVRPSADIEALTVVGIVQPYL